jgi:uncharacterized protein YrrD
MLIEASKLIKLPVAAEDALSKVGQISQIMVDPENGRFLGFLVSTGFLKDKLALGVNDISYWDPAGIITEHETNLVKPSEIVRINNLLEREFDLMGLPAKTETGKQLGDVNDFLLDTETQVVIKYYLKDLLDQSRVMPAEKVVSIDKEIIFTDDQAVDPGQVNIMLAETL